MNIILFILIGWISYQIVQKIMKEKMLSKLNQYFLEKNDQYYEQLVKYYEKKKKVKLTRKLNYFHKTSILIERAGFRDSILMNPITVVLSGMICFFISYQLLFSIFQVVSYSILVALPMFVFPYFILISLAQAKEEKLEKVLLNFLLQLKSYTKINNDILYALKEIKTIEPLASYIDKLLIEVNSGIKFETAIENLKEKVKIKRFQFFLSNLQYCYLYGGDYSVLIDRNYHMILSIQEEKAKRLQETKSARMVLFVLIFLNLFVYITFIKNDYENYTIMRSTLLGNAILYWNFTSIWILLILSYQVKKLDY